MITMPGKYIYQDDPQPSAYNRICSDSIDKSIKIFIQIITSELLSLVIAWIGPVYSYVRYGTMSTFFCVRIPFLNENPDLEFMISFSWELLMGGLAFMAFMVSDVIFVIIIDAINVSSQLIELRLTELSENLEKKHGTEQQSRQQLRIIIMQTEYLDE